jgi:hypothetical protein
MESVKELTEAMTFSCCGEKLPLPEIIENKKIVSVKIAYLSEKKKVKADGLKGILGCKKEVQEEKELIVKDPKGITLCYSKDNGAAVIRFWNKKEFEKIVGYDDSTLWKRYVMSIVYPYQVNFHIGNLKKVVWEDE